MRKLVEDKINSKEIRNLIQNDISSSIFIDAGAGAGKTSSIVGRVLNQIKAGIEPKRIVIITFTNKATEEILTRINDAVYDASKNENDPKLKELLINAFKNLGSMTISTIHSFCYTLLSEKSLNIELPIGVELLEDLDLEDEQNKIFNKWMKSLTKEDYDILAKDEALSSYNVEKIKDYFKLFSKLEDSIYEIEHVNVKQLLNIKNLFDNLVEALDKHGNDFAFLCQKELDEVLNANAKRFLAYREFIDDLDEKDFKDFVDNNLERDKIEAISEIFKEASKACLTTRSRKEEIKSAQQEFNEDIKKITDEIAKAKKYFGAAKLVINDKFFIEYGYKAYQFYKEERTRIKISKDELLYLTNEIVKDNKARQYFASKYDCIYVDEFQDTDHIQADFIWRLTEEIDLYHDEHNIDCGSLVVVGDPKQSIYRFRGADPDVFFKIKKEFVHKKSVIYSLNFNFRSNNLILDYINKEFKDKDIQGGGLSYTPMLYNDNHIVPDPINDKCFAGVFYFNNDPLKTEEDNVASLIKKLIDEEYMIPKFNKKLNLYEWKKVDYNDFLVLFHQFKNSNRFIEAFKKYDIPVSVSGKVDFQREHGLKVFRRLFRGIVTPQDKIAKMGAIEALRMNNYDKSFSDEAEAFKFYNDLYDSILNETKELSGYGKALYLREHLEYILGDNDSYQSINVKLTQAVENAFAKSISNAISLADYFDEYFDSDIKEELILDNESPTIRFMNAHKSKGLEGNIVIWVDNGISCDKAPSLYKDNNVYHFGIELNKELMDKAILEEKREYGRLEYVAATRAMNVLIFSSAIKKEKLFNREGYDYHFNELKDFQIGSLPIEMSEPNLELEKNAYKPYELKEENEYKPNIIHTSPSKYEIHEGRDKTANFNSLRPFGNVLGTIMHRSLELLVLRRKNDEFIGFKEEEIEAIARTAIYESCNDVDFEKDYQKYERFLISVLNSIIKLYHDEKLFIDSDMVEPEFTYSLFDNNKIKEFMVDEDSKIYLNGTMDLFIKYKDRILIIDYKSDFIGYQNDKQFNEIIKKEYQSQLNVYRKSAEIMFNDIKQIETRIIYFKDYDYDKLNIIPVEVEIN